MVVIHCNSHRTENVKTVQQKNVCCFNSYTSVIIPIFQFFRKSFNLSPHLQLHCTAIALRCLSFVFRLSSATLVYCDKTTEARITRFVERQTDRLKSSLLKQQIKTSSFFFFFTRFYCVNYEQEVRTTIADRCTLVQSHSRLSTFVAIDSSYNYDY